MLKTLANSLRVARAVTRLGAHWAPRFVAKRVPASAGELLRGKLHLEPIDGELVSHRDEWLLDGYPAAQALARTGRVRFTMQPSGALRVDAGDFRVDVTTADELIILKEVLYDRLYHFQLPGDCVVLDIGMNVAIPALYFATVLNCPVVGYEVAPDTQRAALNNIGLNRPAVPIEAHQLGVGGTSRTVRMHRSSEGRGLTTMFRRPADDAAPPELDSFDAELVAATEVVERLRASYPHRQIVAKIDCEGAEYEILDSLIASGAIQEITLLMVEWHRFNDDHDPDRLAAILAKAHFTTTLHGNPGAMAGMLYAVQTAYPPVAVPLGDRRANQAVLCQLE